MRFNALFVQFTALLLTAMSLSAHALVGENPNFPVSPDNQLTPGVLCTRPDGYRYPEHIRYCNRNVDVELKEEVIDTYDKARGFRVGRMNREDFKIDHFIPLCMGGANHRDNLWPQHKTVYEVTDPVEPLACQKMAEGKLKQNQAIVLIKKAKLDLKSVPEVMKYLNSL